MLSAREVRPQAAAPTPEETLLSVCGPARPHFAPIDSNGNLTQKVEGGVTWSYVWDAENRLKWVCNTTPCTQGAAVASFLYDALGRRVEKVASAVTTTYTYDGEDILRQIAGGSTLKFVDGPGIDEPLAQEDGSGVLSYLHTDGLGSIVKTTSSAGAVTATRRYDAFGNFELGAANGYAFTGREWDTETGLAYYRARYYDPRIGRFISEDPIRWIAGPNFFSYVANDPVNLSDPFGLMTNARGEADKANAWLADCWLNASGAAGVFVAQNQRMRDNRAGGVDKYFHCMANCEGARQGPCGAGASKILSFVREVYGAAKGDPAQDRRDDEAANTHGRTCPPTQTCAQRCEPLLPPRLRPGFRR